MEHMQLLFLRVWFFKMPFRSIPDMRNTILAAAPGLAFWRHSSPLGLCLLHAQLPLQHA